MLNICQWNAQSLRPKHISFEAFLYQERIHIYSEIWLHINSEFRVSGYNMFRKDRLDSYGGVAVLLYKSIRSDQLCDNNGIEIINQSILRYLIVKKLRTLYQFIVFQILLLRN